MNDFQVGDVIIDSRCGQVSTGTVIMIRGNNVYYRDDCRACTRDGLHHRTQADFPTTRKGQKTVTNPGRGA